MSKCVNKAIILGYLGQDPEVLYTQAGAAITTISIATTSVWTDKATGQKTETTEWHRVVFFNRLAEVAGEYLRKGSQVYTEGYLSTRKWQDQQGQDRYTTEIVASELQMLCGKRDGYNAQGDQQYEPAPQPQRQAPQPQSPQRPAQQQPQRQPSPYANVPHATAPRQQQYVHPLTPQDRSAPQPQQPAPPPTGMVYASAQNHKRTLVKVSSRCRCRCGCKGRETHHGRANGVTLMSGCELYVRRWVRDGK